MLGLVIAAIPGHRGLPGYQVMDYLTVATRAHWRTGMTSSIRIAAVLLMATLASVGQAQTVEYIHTDALGSVVAVTDSGRNVIESREYEPYGAGGALPDGPAYTGHAHDAATGLTYMQQRYYDSSIGRFLSVDPIPADANTGASFNRYRYAANNPYRFTDPDGRCQVPTGSRICRGDISGAVKTVGPVGEVSSNGGGSGRSNARTATTTVTAGGATRPIPTTGGSATAVTGWGALVRGLLGRALITAPLVIGGDSRELDTYLHYGFAADAAKFERGLRAGGFATKGPLMTGPQAQQMLALPHQLPPDSVYTVQVTSSVPVIGPMTVQPTSVPPRMGGGTEYIFPSGTPAGSVTGPYPLPGN